MPAMLEDPASPPIMRASGPLPYPIPGSTHIPPTIFPKRVVLRDRVTPASLLPFCTAQAIPPRLIAYLTAQLNLEVEKGDTYPMITNFDVQSFGKYWFQGFGAVMLLGEVGAPDMLNGSGGDWEDDVARDLQNMEQSGVRWEDVCLGSFYVKPNYPGRSSHVCNGGFLVCDAARNRGVGRLMGEGYLEWAPQLVFHPLTSQT